MKQFGVVKSNRARCEEVIYADRGAANLPFPVDATQRLRGVAWVDYTATKDGREMDWKDYQVYWADHEQDAKQLCGILSREHPGDTYTYFEVKGAVRAQPGPLEEFTINEKGILPK